VDPVLEAHAMMSRGESAAPAEPVGEMFPEGLSYENVSRQVPLVLAAGAVGLIAGLVGFNMMGFRFAFGANVGR
jgi:hypothetical protein